ncbi:MAG: terminase large subunit [Desulfobacterales bacterium]|nr:terminase large subunit [Desulfobacterales bacterium]
MTVRLPEPTPKQLEFIRHPAKRKIVRAGRRGGKTVGVAILAVEKFLEQRRILYAAPTTEQVERFWTEVSRALYEPIEAKIFTKNETEHVIEIPRTETRIKAKTAWDADTLRGDYAGFLILDEWQLMNEDMWELVGAPMLLDCDGDAIFIYTPPSIHGRKSESGKTIRTKARDSQHAAKMFAEAEQDKTGRWAAFHFTSHDNPHISKAGLKEIIRDMTSLAYRMEIMAEDVNEAPGALWKREMIQRATDPGEMARVVVGVDPSATSEGDEAGIVVVGGNNEKAFVLADESLQGSPLAWATAAVTAYHVHKADRVVAESNQGGEMVAIVIGQVDSKVPVTLVHASRGKQTRAEPIAAQYEQGRVHHVGDFPELEDEMCLWVPGDASPNRLDAMVWALTELMLGETPGLFFAGGN